MNNETFLDFAARLRSTPWALEPGRMSALRALVDAGPRSVRASRAPPRRRGVAAGTAVLSIVGILDQREGWLTMLGLGVSCDSISAALNDALNDESVRRIVFDIDSPGGSVAGVIELADQIFAARAKKPIVAVANSLAASAAFWLGSQASRMYMSPGAEVGSIGVYVAHEDCSQALADSGVAVTLVSAGRFKTEAHPFGPLDAAAKAFMQTRVNDYHSAFTKAVARGRGVPIDAVRSGMGLGRTLGAAQAMAERMVDGVMSFGEVMSGGLGAARAGLAAHAPRPNVAAALRELGRLT